MPHVTAYKGLLQGLPYLMPTNLCEVVGDHFHYPRIQKKRLRFREDDQDLDFTPLNCKACGALSSLSLQPCCLVTGYLPRGFLFKLCEFRAAGKSAWNWSKKHTKKV